MVRSVADRAFLPAKSLFEQVGNMMILTGKTITATVRPPYPYGGEFISQFIFALQLCWFPMLISTVAFGFGAPGLQAANFASLFGALDRLGGFFVLASIREFAPEPVKRPEQGGEVGGLKPRGAEAEGDGRDQHRKPAQLEGEDELGDELAAVGVGGPDGGGDRLAGQDHHVPHLLEQRLGR